MTPDSNHDSGREAALMLEAARLFFGECRLSDLAASSGYSGSYFARVQSADGQWVLRRWPDGFDAGQLGFTHRALVESRAGGFEGVPRLASTAEGRTIMRLSGCLYDAQEHLPGRPLSAHRPVGVPMPNVTVRLSPERLMDLARALAHLHRSTANLPRDPDREVAPLSVRLDGLATEANGCQKTLLNGAMVRAHGEERRTALRWLEILPSALAVAHEASGETPRYGDARVVFCHGDLWPAHVFFDEDSFVGLVDFESPVFASPALDLAQLVSRFGGWDLREDVLGVYARVAPLVERCRAAFPLEVIADLAGEGLWSLWSLYGLPPTETIPAQREAHAHNLVVLLGCLKEAYREVQQVSR